MTEMKNMMTTGNLITLGAMVFGGAIAWGQLSAQNTASAQSIAKFEIRIDALETAVNDLSVLFARNDERLLNILSYVQRTDARLGVIEAGNQGITP